MKNKTIAFFDTKPYDREVFEKVNKNFEYNLKFFESKLTEETAILAKEADTVCIFVNDQLTQARIDILKNFGINLVALRSAGYNNVDLKAAYGNMHIVRVPAYSPYAVAEHTVALILSLNRKIHKAYYRVKDNNFTINGFKGFDMHGKTVGVIGTGKIGKIFIEIMSGFGMKILASDPFPDLEFAKSKSVEYVELDHLYRESDIISLNCPMTKETYHLINEKSIRKMKSNVMIVNTGRGQLIDTRALIEGLKNKQIGSAALDVYEEESKYFFEDFSNEIIDDDTLSILLSLNNVLITSHQGFFTEEALNNIATTTLENVTEFFEGKNLTNEICYRCPGPGCAKEKTGKCF
ncbi:MAG: 2-hydroxyacid dehydrogenase [Candidatus Marinimicrobia bacterium]|nr:2-hydroxyacid dehydrogenase [Candidatus Neomarinimicrobiota bacterium]